MRAAFRNDLGDGKAAVVCGLAIVGWKLLQGVFEPSGILTTVSSKALIATKLEEERVRFARL